ncbi:uncharacterized protein BP5553_09652 [Venustampulla echinocandica]|uniref:Uncharacterized protein n=1 Tax=Venustampulla echinocandica TaxID=2656787 RepID=A0A370TBM3_9HELO|nr:uncharacterized protein BP5553_09652 [Venustampulla echinocandica]RDL31443.1 hypothetical protein BP5553_09652 [Venustampulla echinocandica]
MARTVTTQTLSGRARLVGVAKVRDTDFPRAPDHVTDAARAKAIDISNPWRFGFGDPERGGESPERPKTSAGPTAHSSVRKDAEKRETKDDLYFNALSAHGTATTFYNFPLPGSLPASDPPPRELPLLPPRSTSLGRRTPPTRGPSPNPNLVQAAPPDIPDSKMEIGMALGSPSHQPTDWHPQHTTESIERMVSPDVMDDSMGGLVAPVKPKASKWKFLGGLFGGKKHAEAHPQPFYQLQPENGQEYTATVTTGAEVHLPAPKNEDPSSEKRPKSRGRTRTISTRKAKTPKPDIKRANTMPNRVDAQENWQRGTPTPEITLDGHSIESHQSSKNYTGQMLDVDIPTTQMERYSVMFGSVLQKSANTSPSLLARRQATLDKLKTVNEALALKEKELHDKERQFMPRRATSPQPSKSPGFSLFPTTPSLHVPRDSSPSRTRQTTLQRSNTSPAALSPSRPSFAPSSDNKAHATLVSMPSGPKANLGYRQNGTKPNNSPEKQGGSSQNTSHSLAVPKLKEVDRSWSPDHSHLVLDSPGSDIYGDTEDEFTLSPAPVRSYDPAPMKPKLVEPAWEIINKPSEHQQAPPTTASSASGSDHSTSASTSSTSASSVSTAETSHLVSSIDKPSTPPHPTASNSRVKAAQSRSRSKSSPSQTSIASIASNAVEERLRTAADISIARQISVSRQQCQLLVPINKSKTSSNNNPNKKFNQNFPSPAASVNKMASPLCAVAVAASEERGREGKGADDRATSPLVDQKVNLVDSVKPSTPTLVVVPGPDRNEMTKAWGGATAVHGAPVGLAERRKAKGAPIMGEIKVGLAVSRTRADTHTTQTKERHRKSERAVVERVSIASN